MAKGMVSQGVAFYKNIEVDCEMDSQQARSTAQLTASMQ